MPTQTAPEAASTKPATARKRPPATKAKAQAAAAGRRAGTKRATATRSPGTTGRTGTSAKPSVRKVATESARQTKQVATTTAGEGQRLAGEARARSQEVARVARTQTRAVARSAGADARALTTTIKSQAADVRAEVTGQARALADEARTRLAEQAHVQVRRAADNISRLARGTETLAAHASGEASGFGDYLSSGAEKFHGAAERVYSLADDVEAGEFEALMDDVRGFARRRPTAFFTAAAIAGFGVGRLVRASSSDGTDVHDGATAFETESPTSRATSTRRAAAGTVDGGNERGIAP